MGNHRTENTKTHKFCAKRQHVVRRSEFYRNKHNSDGLQAYCKDCQKEVVAVSKQRKTEYVIGKQQGNE